MKTIKQFSFFTLLLFAATSCIAEFNIRGNGVEATEERAVSMFNKIKSSGDFDIQIINGDELEVLVTAEENILPYIGTSVSNNTLQIDIQGMHNVRNRLPMRVLITVPQLVSVKQSGSGSITADYFSGDEMEFSLSGSGSISADVDADLVVASISGSGWIIITGDSNESELNISGSGNIDSSELTVDNCNAHISGSGNMQVNALKLITAKISGSGNVYYTGNPVTETNISGSGKLVHRN
ncbi:MAG: DUF2807 domain-containing protein [Draconibacterium sp.]|nr:DUF2807 domain-containing protein [Draconibacterium sp.]